MNTIINSFIENVTDEIVNRALTKINASLDVKINEAIKLHLAAAAATNTGNVNVKDVIIGLIEDNNEVQDAINKVVSDSQEYLCESDLDDRVVDIVGNMNFEVRVN
jgi:hypothetical protein